MITTHSVKNKINEWHLKFSDKLKVIISHSMSRNTHKDEIVDRNITKTPCLSKNKAIKHRQHQQRRVKKANKLCMNDITFNCSTLNISSFFLCPMLSFSCQPQKNMFIYKSQHLEKIKFCSFLCCWLCMYIIFVSLLERFPHGELSLASSYYHI